MEVMIISMTSFLVYSLLISILKTATSADTISPGQAIRDGDTIVSNDRLFELGFFSPGSSTKRYVGIWYKKVSTGTVVWVANRETPVIDRSGILNFSKEGNLLLMNGTNDTVWSSNTTRRANSPVAQLLDSANLVVRDGNDVNSENYLWQSFDYPCDTKLPGMKLGRNYVTGKVWTVSSWKTMDDPARGEYSWAIDTRGFPQLVLKKANMIIHRYGPWNGVYFTAIPLYPRDPVFKMIVVWNDKETSTANGVINKSLITRDVINASGSAMRMQWMDEQEGWMVVYKIGDNLCDNFAKCGVNSKCKTESLPLCICVDGFKPKSDIDWSYGDWSDGCVRKTPLSCSRGEDFVKYVRLKLPDTSNSWFNTSLSLKHCKKLCHENCSCVAYSSTDIRNGGSGCLHWFNDLVDIQEFPEGGQEIYIRMSASYIDYIRSDRQSAHRKKKIMISCLVISFIVVVLIGGILLKRNKKRVHTSFEGSKLYGNQEFDLPMISLNVLVNSTNNFSSINKLGEGGFGPVYKGILMDGQEIAVKRLSVNSGQGLEEFKNEVLIIAKLQHRNLVKLLGCCIEGNETMLIYEFMPNKSLDHFIYDKTKNEVMDWQKRINIINGIARGLLYLHHDSRLRIIHRDLKASNVLLDIEMNAKISDFGLARTFCGNQTVARTRRVVGTYGYMSPEYAIDGNFSTKSDIFSFGVLLLEIVSGKKNRGFNHPSHDHNLLGHAWILWSEGKPIELIADLSSNTTVLSEILRCIHVGLLCVQQKPEDRPSMSSVVVMLESETPMPEPKQPGFFSERRIHDSEEEFCSSKQKMSSSNYITMSELQPR